MSSSVMHGDCCSDRYESLATERCLCGCRLYYCTGCYDGHCKDRLKALESKTVRVGVAVILFKSPEDPRVLMGQRKGSHGAGSWSFPGGHLEFGETTEHGAARELREETGIDLPRVSFAAAAFTNNVIEGKHYITLFTMTLLFNDQEPKLMEPDRCEGWFWVYTSRLEEMACSDLFLPVRSFVLENPHLIEDTVRNMKRFNRKR